MLNVTHGWLTSDVCGACTTGRDTFHQSWQGMPDGELVAALIKSATGPPPKPLSLETASVQDAPLPPNHSPYFHVAGHVAKATVDFDLNRTFTPADISRRLGERRREARNDNDQYSQDFGHKIFGSSKCVFRIRSFPTHISFDEGPPRSVHSFLFLS